MANIFKLCNQIKHYEWGSPDFIPRLMGVEGDGAPWAELWMGSHPGSPSRIILPSGEASLAEYSKGLPFLFKLLAAEKPLSIQAHPNRDQARAGFDRENKAGLPLDAPGRNYKDANHKPEIICALTPFAGMCGFREPDEIREALDKNQTVFAEVFAPPLAAALEKPDAASALRHFLEALFGLDRAAREALTSWALALEPESVEKKLMREFARLYPGDPAIIAPLYLNVFQLEPGEAVFLNDGVLHAYIRGLGVELMANSDNVLRGGLTPKHVDVPELLAVLDFRPYKPRIIKPPESVQAAGRFDYPASCAEFALSVLRGDGCGQARFSSCGPSICIVTQGEVSAGGMILKQGESAFIPAAATEGEGGALALRGRYTLYMASVPQ